MVAKRATTLVCRRSRSAKTRGHAHNPAIEAIEAMMATGLAGIALVLSAAHPTDPRPADHLMNGSTPAGNVSLQLS
jgi:hypothetical protein